MVRFLDPEIVEMVDRSFMSLTDKHNEVREQEKKVNLQTQEHYKTK